MYYVIYLFDGAPDGSWGFDTMDEAMAFCASNYDPETYWERYDILTEDEYMELMDSL